MLLVLSKTSNALLLERIGGSWSPLVLPISSIFHKTNLLCLIVDGLLVLLYGIAVTIATNKKRSTPQRHTAFIKNRILTMFC